jgi:hypothetical protein
MIQMRHFKGRYKAVYESVNPQYTHAHAFYAIDIKWIEITDVYGLSERFVESEKVGDYFYLPYIQAQKKSFFDNKNIDVADIVIRKDEQTIFSDDLHQVVLCQHSKGRKAPSSPVRFAIHSGLTNQAYYSEGFIYFSLEFILTPTNTIPSRQIADNTDNIHDTLVTSTEIVHTDSVPQSYFIRQSTDYLSSFKGCLFGIGSLLKWSIIVLLAIGILGFLATLFQSNDNNTEQRANDDGAVQLDNPNLNPKQDTLAPMPWDYLTMHRIRWNDFIDNKFYNIYNTSSTQFNDSRRLHEAFAGQQFADQYACMRSIYSELSRHDQSKLDSLSQYFIAQRVQKNLSPLQTAEMVVTFIQEIPYYLVHDGTCQEAISAGGFARKYHLEGKPCLANVVAGVQSPYEFAHDLKGDCDTRSLLGYTLLTKLGIPASIWISEAYGHSVLGVGVASGGHYYKTVNGIRYLPVELTAKGFRVGMIAPQHGDMDNWVIILTNK